MATTRQVVRVFSSEAPNTVTGEVALPAVFTAPIRNDITQFVFYNLNKNRRQAYGVNLKAGMLYNAESWGTGRAVARIPRVGGSGTHRSGQGAFGNMCRGGRMFNPTNTWRRWHRKVNVTQRRHAVASAIAASAVPSLVLARGHRVNQVPEVPLVVDRLNFEKTSSLIEALERLGLSEELNKVKSSRKLRVGAGKARNRRYVQKRGPLIVFDNETRLLANSARNIPGVDICHVDRLNLLQLAPGGHLGRLIVWTRNAFEQLNHIFGTHDQPGVGKKGYVLERPLLHNANLARLINSDEIQSVVRPKQKNVVLHDIHKRNPLKNKAIMHKLNPFDKERNAQDKATRENNIKNRDQRLKTQRAERKKHRQLGRKFIRTYRQELNDANKQTINEYDAYIRSQRIGKKALENVAEEEE